MIVLGLGKRPMVRGRARDRVMNVDGVENHERFFSELGLEFGLRLVL